MKNLLLVVCVFASMKASSQIVNIPDPIFKNYLVSEGSVNTNADTEIQVSEANAFSGSINISGLGISDLTGLESFVNVVGVYAYSNNITSFNFSSNTQLEELVIAFNNLTSIDVSGCAQLEFLGAGENDLTTIDVSANNSLSALMVAGNPITSISYPTGNGLITLDISNTGYTATDFNDIPNLQELYCSGNGLTTIDLTLLPDLVQLTITDNALTALDVSSCNALTFLYCNSNPALGSLDVTTNSNLQELGAANCGLTSMDLSGNPQLINCDLSYNSLTGLDLTNNTMIEKLYISYNDFSGTLNVTGGSSLQRIYFGNNQVTDCQLTNFPNLTHLDCRSNLISDLGVLPLSLERIDAQYNTIVAIDLTTLAFLQSLDLTDNLMTTLNIAQCPLLEQVYLSNTPLTELITDFNTQLVGANLDGSLITALDFSFNTNLNWLSCNSMSQLSELNIKNGNNSAIYYLGAMNCPMLSCIQVSDVTYATTNWTSIDPGAIFSTMCPYCTVYIPDWNLKYALVGNAALNTNSDTEIQCSEAIAYVGALNLAGLSLNDLTGINEFVNLTSLDCSGNNLTSLPIAPCTALTELHAADNNFTAIDLSANVGLNEVILSGNPLTSLDVSGLPNLVHLEISFALLTSIQVSSNSNLEVLNVSNNQLNSLDVSSNVNLETINASDNELTQLDLSSNTALISLEVQNNQLTELNVANGNNSNMTFFDALNNDLACIKVDDAAYSTANWNNVDPGTTFDELCDAGQMEGELIWSISPSPATDYIHIQGNTTGVTCKIFDVSGALISTPSVTDIVDVSALSPGIYFITLSSPEGWFEKHKLIIR